MLADDVALLIKHADLNWVLEALGYCGRFTGLKLNVSKTVAFDPHNLLSDTETAVQVVSQQVKYLGAFLGTDPMVESLNFDMIQKKMRTKIDRWKHRITSLQGWVLVIKVIIFLCCTHVLNSVHILSKHLDQIQHMLNEFLWKGKNKVPQSTFCQDLATGGLRMLKVCNSVLVLYVRWMVWLWNDEGKTWSGFAWQQVLTDIPWVVIPGLIYISDAWMKDWDPFYQDVFWAYVQLNVMACSFPTETILPKNVWACWENKVLNLPLIKAGIIEVADLPLTNGSIDYNKLQELSCEQGSRQSVFLMAVSLQEKFKSWFHIPALDRQLPLEPIKKVKNIIHNNSWQPSTLTKWEIALQIPSQSVTDTSLIFKRLVQKIKVSKLLATLALIAKICKIPTLASCYLVW